MKCLPWDYDPQAVAGSNEAILLPLSIEKALRSTVFWKRAVQLLLRASAPPPFLPLETGISLRSGLDDSCFCSYEGFHDTALTYIALGEAVPCRQEVRWPKRISVAKDRTSLLMLSLRYKKYPIEAFLL